VCGRPLSTSTFSLRGRRTPNLGREAQSPVVGEAQSPVVGEAQSPVVGEAQSPVVGAVFVAAGRTLSRPVLGATKTALSRPVL
jgi:hypothetical protein